MAKVIPWQHLAVGVIIMMPVAAHAQTTTCREWQGIHYCDGPGGYRSEQHDWQGMTYGSDNRGNAWETREWQGMTYTTQTRKGRP
jgi:hypothetical protein